MAIINQLKQFTLVKNAIKLVPYAMAIQALAINVILTIFIMINNATNHVPSKVISKISLQCHANLVLRHV